MSDIEGVENLKTADKDMIKKLVKEWKSGNMKDQVPKITRKRKADGDQDDDKKKKKKTDKSKKSKKTQDSDEEEDSSFKLSKSRKATKSSDDDDTKLKKSSSSKKQDSDEDEDEDEDDDKFNRILKGRTSSNTKRVVESESEDKSEEEKTKPKRKAKTSTKKTKSDESEEVKESASSEEENNKFLSGKIIALCGKLSLPREKVIELIEKNGGKYAKTITNKDVTHVICAKTDDKTQKLQKAKEAGKILVTESFFKKRKVIVSDSAY